MPAAAIGGAAAIYGASQNRVAARDSARQAQAGLDWTKQVYGDAQGNFAPYLGLGQSGLSGLQALMGGDYSGLYNSPDFKFAYDTGIKALDSSAAARGRLFSGGHQKDLVEYGQGLASQQLGNFRNSLFGMAQMGQNAAGTLGGIGTGTAQQVNQAYGNIAQANQGRYDSNAQLGGALGNLFGQWWNSRTPSTGSAYGSSYGSGYGTGIGAGIVSGLSGWGR